MHLIGIRREDKNPFERRTPLIPEHVAALKQQHGVSIAVQPSPRRIYPEEAFVQAGAGVDDTLEACPIILGVKEVPVAELRAEKAYVFFSHTIKGQDYNMPMLRRLLELGCTLIDYERIVDAQGKRLVFFGRHAGLAGMIDSLWALGQRLLTEGMDTPFAQIRQAHTYDSLDEAKAAVSEAGQALARGGMPGALEPMVFGVTGYGNVSMGAQEILDLLCPTTVTPGELASLDASARGIVKVVYYEKDLVEPLEGAFELQDYYDHPERYRSTFSSVLDRLTVLVNCIYWEPRYPRLVTLDDLTRLYSQPTPRLRVIGDISCDVQGSVEATLRATEPDNPVFVYDITARAAVDGVQGKGPVIMSVDNLPAELPRDASATFSAALSPFIPRLARANLSAPFAQSGLPEELASAVIVYRGHLTEDYAYLADHL